MRQTSVCFVALRFLAVLLVAVMALPRISGAAVLPEDRADLLYHRYEGGGITIQGPSMLVRKKIGENFSVNANYYVDMISSASIDVLSTASPYKEERKQFSIGTDYLRGKTLYSLNYIHSKENDFTANTAIAGLSHDMFGDLTTVSLGFARGWNVVGERNTPSFKQDMDSRTFSTGLSQILTKRLIATLEYEVVTDEGFLNNPYRKIRYLDPLSGLGYAFADEKYPHTHTSSAASIGGRYLLPFHAALNGSYRFYSDTWGIVANTAEIGYTQPYKNVWTFEVSYRYYTQTHADFYSDLFPRIDFQNFMGRDKELAAFDTSSIHLGATYNFLKSGWHGFDKASVSFYYDRLQFNYKDFRNDLVSLRNSGVKAGTEPLYSFDANVIQCFVSFWF